MPIPDQLATALARTTETADVDFKSAFDATSAGEWLEIIKDIVALANSGGGLLII
jgi:predicted HTH transcriptional regulator